MIYTKYYINAHPLVCLLINEKGVIWVFFLLLISIKKIKINLINYVKYR